MTRGAASDDRARVFLSWSGMPSKLLAQALADAMETLSDRLEPWLSDDQEPGSEWASGLAPQIRQARLAVLCLTHRNVNAPWISFETGVYYTSRLRKGVIPFLLDFKPEELAFPLGLFQGLTADWKGTKALFVRLGSLVGLDEKTVEQRVTTDLWPQLEDHLESIRGIAGEIAPTDDVGHWMNVANAFYLGHDLRWTIDVLEGDGTPEDVKHGLRQTLHQASELGLSQHNHFVVLAAQAAEVLQLPDKKWTPEVRAMITSGLKTAFERFGGLAIAHQPGYRSCDPENMKNWLRVQKDGRA